MDANKQYLTTKIDPILEPLITQVLLEKPQDLVDYILKFLEKMQKRPGKTESKKAAVSFESKNDQSHSAHKPGAEKSTDATPHTVAKTPEQKERIRQLLKNLFLFRVVSAKDHEVVIDAMEEKIVADGTAVIKQDDEGDNFYVVDSGKLGCFKTSVSIILEKLQKEEGGSKLIREYVAGDAFGELALLYNTPRAATIIAKSEVSLWSLDGTTFKNTVKNAIVYLNSI